MLVQHVQVPGVLARGFGTLPQRRGEGICCTAAAATAAKLQLDSSRGPRGCASYWCVIRRIVFGSARLDIAFQFVGG